MLDCVPFQSRLRSALSTVSHNLRRQYITHLDTLTLELWQVLPPPFHALVPRVFPSLADSREQVTVEQSRRASKQ
jgi:hypothetical protein